jgi:hypothetical protein
VLGDLPLVQNRACPSVVLSFVLWLPFYLRVLAISGAQKSVLLLVSLC